MKVNTKIVLAALAIALAGIPAYAATTAATTGSCKAIVIAPTTVTHNSGAMLDFGRVVNTTAGTVTIAAKDGAVTVVGITAHDMATTADGFTIVGQTGMPFTVNMPSTITVTSGSETMTVSNITHFCGTGATSACTITSAGTKVQIGGTLNVVPQQATGLYNGTYPLTVTY